jgi:hypothetical protein
MSDDPRNSLHAAAARPTRPPDLGAIQSRGNRLRTLRVVGASALVLALLSVGSATVALVGDDRDALPPAESGPSDSPDPSPSPDREYVTHEKDSNRPFRVTVPADWYWAEDSLTPKLVDPRELFATGTFPLVFRETECQHLPGSVLRDITATDVFLTVQERVSEVAPDVYPGRPDDFRQKEDQPVEGLECVPEGVPYDAYWIGFSENGRNFYALLAIGKDAGAATRDDAWAALNSFEPLPWDGVNEPPGDEAEDGEQGEG